MDHRFQEARRPSAVARLGNVRRDAVDADEPDHRDEERERQEPREALRAHGSALLAAGREELSWLDRREVIDVRVARLRVGERVVLGEDRGEVPAVQLAQDANGASGAVLCLG